MEKTLLGINDLKTTAHDFVNQLSLRLNVADKALIVALSGDLGVGKTTFVQTCASIVGIKEVVTSPTFVIQKIYKLNKDSIIPFEKFIHIDAYRLKDHKELVAIGWDNIINDSKSIIFLEWPEIIKKGLPKDNIIKIELSHAGDEKREIKIFYE